MFPKEDSHMVTVQGQLDFLVSLCTLDVNH